MLHIYARHNRTLSSYIALAFAVVLAVQPLAVFASEPGTAESTSAVTTATSEQPALTQTAPVEEPKQYYYDAETNMWNTDKWKYDGVSGGYIEQHVAPAPVTIVEPSVDGQSNSNTTSNSTVTTTLNSIASSGAASVLSNTVGGSATTGDASASALIINNLQSTLTSANNMQAANFVSDITGDVNGDIILQPMLLKAMLEAQAIQNSKTTTESSTDILNNLNLSATSGDASVAGNTRAGNAITGDASTVVDVVNIVNSMIASNESFVGTVNIYGNLNGDILIAPDFMSQLLAINGGVTQHDGTHDATNSTTTDIVNNVSLAAKSGEALVLGNTNAGSASSGEANTNIVIFNLSGHEIIASNSLLVFVNVLGKWVGVIVDAPTGTTAAVVGDNVERNTSTLAPSMSITSTTSNRIVNNISLTSESGDASVARNTTAGSATSGSATALANIANISNTNIGLSGWFGILFINVYGTWLGSFGVDTLAGSSPIVVGGGVSPVDIPLNAAESGPLQVLSFRPSGEARTSSAASIVTPQGVQVIDDDNITPNLVPVQAFSEPILESATDQQSGPNLILAVVSFVVTSLLLSGAYVVKRELFA